MPKREGRAGRRLVKMPLLGAAERWFRRRSIERHFTLRNFAGVLPFLPKNFRRLGDGVWLELPSARAGTVDRRPRERGKSVARGTRKAQPCHCASQHARPAATARRARRSRGRMALAARCRSARGGGAALHSPNMHRPALVAQRVLLPTTGYPR